MSLVGAVDAVSRRLAIDLLLHMAKNMEHRQFLFITPQDLSSVQPTDFVRTQTRYTLHQALSLSLSEEFMRACHQASTEYNHQM
jgi:hypothetical protein